MQNRPAAGKNTLSGLSACWSVGKFKKGQPGLRRVDILTRAVFHICFLLSQRSIPFSCSESLSTLGSRAMLIMLDSNGELLVVTQT